MTNAAKRHIARLGLGMIAAISVIVAALGPVMVPSVYASTYAPGGGYYLAFGSLTSPSGTPYSSFSGACGFSCSLNASFVNMAFDTGAVNSYTDISVTITPNSGDLMQSFTVYYNTDGSGTWTSLGSMSVSSGINTLSFGAVSARYFVVAQTGAARWSKWDAVTGTYTSSATNTPTNTATITPTNTQTPTQIATTAPNPSGLTTALIGYWPFDSAVASSASPSYGGESLSGTTCSIVTAGPGVVSGAYYLGNTSCLSGIDADPVRIDPAGDWTWAGWIYPQDTTAGHQIIGKSTTLTNTEFFVQYNAGGVAYFCWGTAGTNCLGSTTTTSSTITQNAWNFIAFGKINNTAWISLNNKPRAVLAGTTGWQTVSSPLRFGLSSAAGLGSGFDEWGLWRSATGAGGALTDAQLSALFNGGSGCSYPFTTCANYGTPQPSPTPPNSNDSPNLLINGSFEIPQSINQTGIAAYGWNRTYKGPNGYDGVVNVIQNSNNVWGGLPQCGSQYYNVNGIGISQRAFLPGATPLYLSFYMRRKLDDSGRSFAQFEIDSTANGGSAGVDWTVEDGKRGDYIGRSATSDGWLHVTTTHPFLVPYSQYYDIKISSIKYIPGGWYYNGSSNVWIPPTWDYEKDPSQDWQIDNIVLTTSGYGSYCTGSGATATPNPTITRQPTSTSQATSTGPTFTPSATPTGSALVFANCSFELGSTGWDGIGFSIQLAGGPVGPQFLRLNGAGTYAQQPFDWGGGTAYFTFWVGPASGGSVQVLTVNGRGKYELWNFSESSPAWKQIRVTIPALAPGHYQFMVNGISGANMDVDGALPSANGYTYCNTGTTQATPTEGSTAFVTPTPTLTPPSTLTLLAPSSTPRPVGNGNTATPNATWTASATSGPATSTSTPSPTPTAANDSTSTAVAGTGTAFASITPSTATVTATGTPPTRTPSPMPNPTQQPEPAPNADCNRPDNPLNLAWWVDYEVCRVLTWFVWTPDNTQQMVDIQATLTVYEPMGTLNELDNARNVALDQVQAYDWANTGLQGTTGLPNIAILFPNTTPTGLLTGNFQLGPGAPNSDPFVTTCTLKTGAIFGDAMGEGLCASVNWLVSTGIMGWVQFLFDVAVWIAFMRYVWNLVVTKLPQMM